MGLDEEASSSSSLSENFQHQQDEIEALSAIFFDTIQQHSINHIEIAVRNEDDDADADLCVCLHVRMPPTYPLESPPSYELGAPFLRGPERGRLSQQLDEAGASLPGQSVVYEWVDRIKTFLKEYQQLHRSPFHSRSSSPKNSPPSESSLDDEALQTKCPEILTGDRIEDRKSVFQAHFALVRSTAEVDAVIRKLKENRKIAQATHNISAYRIMHDGPNSSSVVLQDSDDDGESHAGGRLLHLLQLCNVQNVLVVVTRWYGGILLGPDRFKHINNAARGVLVASGVVKEAEGKNSKATGKKNKRKV